MKTRFTTIDVCAAIAEIQEKLIGLRVANVYDVDNKTYLFKLAKPEVKAMLAVESGLRLHMTEFDWPKNNMPSSFSFKMRKHLKGRRLVSINQLGIDRIVDLQFGSDDAAYHVIIELYDRGNIALTDSKYNILNLLRYRKDNADSDVKIAVNEIYPIHSAKKREDFITKDKLKEILQDAKENELIKRILNPFLPYGSACIEHCLKVSGIPLTQKVDDCVKSSDEFVEKLHSALSCGEEMLNELLSCKTRKGFIIQKQEKKTDGSILHTNVEYHPVLFKQHSEQHYIEVESFNKAVDEFYGKMESQKADMKVIQKEKNALKTLNNFKKDHEQRLTQLAMEQQKDAHIASLIEENLHIVDQAIKVVRSAVANQIDWEEIGTIVKDAQNRGDQVALAISRLKLETNSIVMLLKENAGKDIENDDDDEFFLSDDENVKPKKEKVKPIKVEIDLGLSAHANAKMYYDKKRQAALKQKKTVEASEKAFKSAEKKTKQILKDVADVQNIQKARKPFWFEKFLWFVTSENLLVLGGRDAQQNEILVRRYLKAGDVYVHADVHGATSCIVKNPNGTKQPIPPKSLNEAGSMAICHSAAWEAKIVISAWWVNSEQVSKTAPSGEYLTTGSFLIRGKKNYLPPSFLVYGFGLLFKVDETCVWRHKGERKIRTVNDDLLSIDDTASIQDEEDVDISSSDSESAVNEDNSDKNVVTLSKISEEVDLVENKESLQELDADSEVSNANVNQFEMEYPDTNIKISLITNDNKYELNDNDETDDHNIIRLGGEDNDIMNLNPQDKTVQNSKPRMSAKQRRDLKKKTKAEGESEPAKADGDSISMKSDARSIQQEPPKRGQKKKLNKIKNKYKNQDEDERRLKMELLQQQSAFAATGKKAKKQEKKRQKQILDEKRQANAKLRQNKPKPQAKLSTQPNEELDSDEEREMILQEEHLLHESANILDSLTGCPHQEDTLLFAIPICGPYNIMQNYKYKVKLTPGNTKKGKAAKASVNLFQSMKDATNIEKTHIKSIKDNDLNRYLPGKVKVSAPHIQSQRKKK